MTKRLATVYELSREIGYAPQWWRNAADAGRVVCLRDGVRGKRMISRESAEALVASLEIATTEPRYRADERTEWRACIAELIGQQKSRS